MKTIYSLREFHEKAVEISGKEPDHVSVTVTIALFGKFEFNCYAVNIGLFSGKTIEETLQKLQYAIKPPKPQNIDVEIEVEQETETI
jgi:hypothetical protein